MATTNEVDAALAALAAAYPLHFKQSSERDAAVARRVYHLILSDLNGALLEAAAVHWVSTSHPFHPAPGELRAFAYALQDQTPSAEEAWGLVTQAKARYGSYGSPEFNQPLVAQAVEIMGWRNLCLSENEVADRAHFFRVYDSLSARKTSADLMLPEVRQTIQALKEGKVHDAIASLTAKLKLKGE